MYPPFFLRKADKTKTAWCKDGRRNQPASCSKIYERKQESKDRMNLPALETGGAPWAQSDISYNNDVNMGSRLAEQKKHLNFERFSSLSQQDSTEQKRARQQCIREKPSAFVYLSNEKRKAKNGKQ